MPGILIKNTTGLLTGAGKLKAPVKPSQAGLPVQPYTGEPVPVPNSSRKTAMYTYFTQGGQGTAQLATFQDYTRVRLTLEDAGPVAVGTQANLVPVEGGAGILLPTDIEKTFIMGPGEILYVAANGKNRVAVVLEPLPPSDRSAP